MAVQGGFFWDETFIASASSALGPYPTTAGQWRAVCLSTGLTPASVGGVPQLQICASATEGVNGAVGILQNDPKVSQAAIVRLLGTSKMEATTSAAVTYGALVTVNAIGQAMVADTSGQRLIGQCISASTGLVSGSLIEVMMFPRPVNFLI
jgi:hypothetical protein